METVAVIGASPKEDRYSNKAMKMLEEHHHTPIPVAPGHDTILEKQVFKTINEIPEDLDTVTMYLAPQRQDEVLDDIIAKAPKRVIFNPGSENKPAYERLESNGIKVVEACTLVLLRTGQY
ncbi:MAG: CoA-binding protein [Desulfobacteraceae bacterium]|nr:MAG: CoA-binding protein [Desulfobacteraceae bacterium]